MSWRFQTYWILANVISIAIAAVGPLNAQSADPNNALRIEKIESDVIQKLSAIEKARWGKADHFTRSKTARQIACSLAANDSSYAYSAVLSTSEEGDLSRMQSSLIRDSRTMGVGTWFAVTKNHPEGAYWVVVLPLRTTNPVWYMLSIFTDCPLLNCTRFDGAYPVTSACENRIR